MKPHNSASVATAGNAGLTRALPEAVSRRVNLARQLRVIGLILSLVGAACSTHADQTTTWKCGTARAKITPKELFWMAGFAARSRPAEGTLDDLWVKALVLEASDGSKAVLVTADLVGIPKWLYENLCRELGWRHGLTCSQLRFAASHTHSGPVLTAALQDIYPLDDEQRARIARYSRWLEQTILETVTRALASQWPATLWAGEGRATFALNRRTNDERKLPEMIRDGVAPRGPSDFTVPVLLVRAPQGPVRAIVFGYAAHTSTLTQNYLWSADYCGVSVAALEAQYPEATAMFWLGCGGDQSAAQRGTVELCRERGQELASAVAAVLDKPMRPIAPGLRTAFDFVSLDFGAQPTKAELEAASTGADYRARWARRLLSELTAGNAFARGYAEYPVQVWKLGEDQLWIALGGEVCVDYALRFKKDFGPTTWVTGYANDVMAYIPSHRVWEEGGYQAGAFEVYGLPATRWCGDIEDRITGAVARLVAQVR